MAIGNFDAADVVTELVVGKEVLGQLFLSNAIPAASGDVMSESGAAANEINQVQLEGFQMNAVTPHSDCSGFDCSIGLVAVGSLVLVMDGARA